jgi:hypothetical protein
MALTCCGEFASFAKFAVAIGNWVEPTPVTSTLSSACAVPAAIRQDAMSVLRPSFVIKLMLYSFPKAIFKLFETAEQTAGRTIRSRVVSLAISRQPGAA